MALECIFEEVSTKSNRKREIAIKGSCHVQFCTLYIDSWQENERYSDCRFVGRQPAEERNAAMKAATYAPGPVQVRVCLRLGLCSDLDVGSVLSLTRQVRLLLECIYRSPIFFASGAHISMFIFSLVISSFRGPTRAQVLRSPLGIPC